MRIRDMILSYRRRIGWVLALVVIAKVAWIVEPTVFGHVIDAMIGAAKAAHPIDVFLVPLLIWAGVFLLNTGAGTWQRSYEAKVYNEMYGDIAGSVAETGRKNGEPTGRIAARVELAREFLTCFRRRVPDILEEVFDLAGTIIALTFYDWRLGLTAVGVVVPLGFINTVYNRRVVALEKELHDGREEVFDVFESNDPQRVRSYYAGLARTQRRIANWGALNFGVIRAFLLVVFIVVLYISIDLDDFSTGDIYSVAAYVWTFVTSAEFLPDLMESRASIADISSRLRTEEA
jgi:ABC-type multidrug transport system fused ATPase/permease subunit